jgi:hypothetical protein
MWIHISLMNFIVNNQEHFQTISFVHSKKARNRNYLHRPVVSLSRFQKKGIVFRDPNIRQSQKSLTNESAENKMALEIYLTLLNRIVTICTSCFNSQHFIFMGSLWFSVQTWIISLICISKFMFIMVTGCVLFEVWIEFLNTLDELRLQRVKYTLLFTLLTNSLCLIITYKFHKGFMSK